jgi:hypothetical protein
VPAAVERPAPQAVPVPTSAPARASLAPGLRVFAATAVVASAVIVGWLTAPLLRSGRGPEPALQTPAQVAPAEPAPARAEPEAAAPVAPPVLEPAVSPEQRAATPAARPPAARTTPQPQRRPAVAAPSPVPAAPTVGSIRGVVRDAASGVPLAGARVTVPGTSLSATTDAAGAFVIADVSPGTVSLAVTLADRPAASHDVVVQAGAAALAELALGPAPQPAAAPVIPAAPVEADEELAAGGWVMSDLESAASTLGIPLAVIPGLHIESVASPAGGSRPRVRIAQLTASGQRIVLTETRAGAPVPGTPRVTALRIIPASQTYPLTTGTASFGNLLVTAKAAMSGEALRALLATLVVAGPNE